MMIEEFSFGNFRSFKDIQTLNLSAAKIKSKNIELDKNNLIKVTDKVSVLKSKAIYGANASGKSNIIKALVAFIKIIYGSAKDQEILNIIDSFSFSEKLENEPSFFQLIFRHEGIRYRYGFEADNNEVKSEWLFFTPGLREQFLFIREEKEKIKISKTHFEEGVKLLDLLDFEDEESSLYRKNSLFLSTISTFGFAKLSKGIINEILSISIINGLGNEGVLYKEAREALNNERKKKFIVDFLKKADTGIEDLDLIELDSEGIGSRSSEFKKIQMVLSEKSFYNKKKVNKKIVVPFEFFESEGTMKMFEISPYIYDSLHKGTPLFIDEFDARFHPLLTKKIVELYNSDLNKGSQLVFITHDTNLLSSDLLRRDQIDFIEKDKHGGSHLYTLLQIKGVRNNASFEKDYINGKYGAIPFLGRFHEIFEENEEVVL